MTQQQYLKRIGKQFKQEIKTKKERIKKLLTEQAKQY